MAVDPVARGLQTAADCVARLQRDHRNVTANMAAGMTPVRTITNITTDPDGSVTWTSVEAQGNLRIQTKVGYYQQLVERALAALLEADLLRGLNVTANTVPLVAHERCDGGHGDWADPTCERNAVSKGIWIDGVQYQLCDRCWGSTGHSSDPAYLPHRARTGTGNRCHLLMPAVARQG
jgi:hypothetical protein